MLYLGIDPGSTGGLCALQGLSGKPSTIYNIEAMPPTERDVWDYFESIRRMTGYAVIEKVGGYIGVPTPGSAMFNFGKSYGGLRMALVAAQIRFEEVTPQAWQKEYGMKKADKETKTSWKNRLKARAQQLFPDTKVTLATADAILIAEYCRRKYGGDK